MKRHSTAIARKGFDDDDEDAIPEKAQGVRYINDDMIAKVSGQRNLALITELDLTLSKEGGKKIRYIENLDKLKKLQVLSLSYNMIEKIEKLDSLSKLRELNLSFNRLSRIEGLETLVNLQVLNLNGNLIQVIPAWLPKKLKALRTLKLAKNSIESLDELKKLRSLANLSQLMCSENPISELPHCRPFLIFHLRSMEVLDGQKVHSRDRADADERFAQEEVEDLQSQLLEMERKYETLTEEHNRSLDDFRANQDKTTALRQLQVNEAERIKQLEAEVEAKNELLKKKSSELSKACQKHYQLEQELAFFKIDSKFSKLGEKPPSPEPEDTEVSLIAESPYIGRAKYTTNSLAHERMLPHGGRQLQLRERLSDESDGRTRRPMGQLENGAESMDYELEIVARRRAIADAESRLGGLQHTLSETEEQIVLAAEQLLQLTAASGGNRPLTDPEKQALKQQHAKKVATISDLRAKAQKVNAMLGRIDEEKEALEAQINKVDEELRGLDPSHSRYSELSSARDERLKEARSAHTAGDQLRGELERLGELLRREMHAAHVLEQQLLQGQTLPAGIDAAAARRDLASAVSSLKDYIGRRRAGDASPVSAAEHTVVEDELRSQRDELAKKVAQLESEMSVLDAEASENNDLRRRMAELQQSLEKERNANDELQQKLNDTVMADADLSVNLRETQEEVSRLQRELENARKEASAAHSKSSQSSTKPDSSALKQLKEENRKLVAKLEQREADLRTRMQAAESLLQPDAVQAKLRALLSNVEQKKLPPAVSHKDPLDKTCAELQTSLVEKIKRTEADAAEAKKKAEKMVADAEEVRSAKMRQLEMEIARQRRAYEAKEAAAANEIRRLQALVQQAEQTRAQSSDTDGMSLIDEMRSELGDLRKQLYDKQATAAEQLADAQTEIERLKQELEAEKLRAEADGRRRRPADPVLFQDQQPRRNQLSPSKRPVRPPFNEGDSSDSSAWPTADAVANRGSTGMPPHPGADYWASDEDAPRPHGAPRGASSRNGNFSRTADRRAAQMADELRRANDELAHLRDLLNERERLLNEEATYADQSEATIETQRQELERLQSLLQQQEDEIDRLNGIISNILSSGAPDPGSQPPADDYVKTISDIQDRLDELKGMIEPSRSRQHLPQTPVSVAKGRGVLGREPFPHQSPRFVQGPSFRAGSDNILPDWKAKSHSQQTGIVTSTPHGNRRQGQQQPLVVASDQTQAPADQLSPDGPHWHHESAGQLQRPQQRHVPHQDARRGVSFLDHSGHLDGAGSTSMGLQSSRRQQPPSYYPNHSGPAAPNPWPLCSVCSRPAMGTSQNCTTLHGPAQPEHHHHHPHEQPQSFMPKQAVGSSGGGSGHMVCSMCADKAKGSPMSQPVAATTATPAMAAGMQQQPMQPAPASATTVAVMPGSGGAAAPAAPYSLVPTQTVTGPLPHILVLPSAAAGQLTAATAGNQSGVGRSIAHEGRADGLVCNVQDHHHLEDDMANLQRQVAKLKSKQHKAKKRLAELGAVQSLQRELEKRQQELESLGATVEEQTTEMHRLRGLEGELMARKQHLQEELSTLRSKSASGGSGRARTQRSANGSRGAIGPAGDEKSLSESEASSALREADEAEERRRARERYLQDEIRCLEETISKRRAELRAADRRLHSCQSDLEMAKKEALTTVLTYDEAQQELDAAAEEAVALRESAAEARADLEELTDRLRELDEQRQEKGRLLDGAESELRQRGAELREAEAALQATAARLHVLEEECKLKEQQCREADLVTSQARDTGELLNQRLRDMEELEAKLKAKRGDLQTVNQALAEARADLEAAAARAAQERLAADELAADGTKLRSELQEKRRLLEGMQQKQEELEGCAKEGEGQLARVMATIQQQQHSLVEAATDLQQKRDELQVIQDTIDRARLEADEARHATSSQSVDLERAKLQVEMMERELAELASLSEARQAECSRLESAVKERSDALRSLAAEKDSMERTLAAAAGERDRLQSVCTSLQEKAADLKRAQYAREESLRAGEQELQHLQQQQSVLSSELEQMADRKAASTRESALLEQQIKDQKAEQLKLKKQASDYDERIKRLEKEAAVLQATVDAKSAALQQTAAEEQVLRQAIGDSRRQLDACREASTAAECQLRQLDADRAERQRGVEQLTHELTLLQDRLAESRADGDRRLEMLSREVAAKRAALESITTECAEVAEQLAVKVKVASQVQDLECRLATVGNEHARLLAERERLAGDVFSLQQQLESVHARLQKNAKSSADAAAQHRRQLDELYAEMHSVKQRYAADVERLEEAVQGHSRRADHLLSDLGEARLQLQQLQAKLHLQEELAAKDKHLEATLETIKSEIQTEVAQGLTELEKSRSEAAIQLSDLQFQKSQMEQQLETLKENMVRSATRLSTDGSPWSAFDRESAAKREALRERFLVEQNQLRDKLFEQMSRHISSLERARSQSDTVLSNLQRKVVDLEEVLSSNKPYGTDSVPIRLSAGRGGGSGGQV